MRVLNERKKKYCRKEECRSCHGHFFAFIWFVSVLMRDVMITEDCFFLSIKPKHGMRLFVNLRKLYTNCTWIVPEDISSRLHNKFEKYPVKVWWLNTCQITIIWENWLLKSNFRKNWLLFVKGFGPVVILITLHLTRKIKMSEKIGISIHSSWKVHQHSYKAW